MIESVFYNVGIYCRLSLDDGSVGESGSIQTQKMMLEKYCKDNHYTINEVYIDDGYSGVNCHRWPAEIDNIIAGDDLIVVLRIPIHTSKYKIVISNAWLIRWRWINWISLFLFTPPTLLLFGR